MRYIKRLIPFMMITCAVNINAEVVSPFGKNTLSHPFYVSISTYGPTVYSGNKVVSPFGNNSPSKPFYMVYSSMMVTGDNLGNHIATTTLQMGIYGINTSSSVTANSIVLNTTPYPVTLTSSATATESTTIVMPPNKGAAGYLWHTDGNGATYWAPETIADMNEYFLSPYNSGVSGYLLMLSTPITGVSVSTRTYSSLSTEILVSSYITGVSYPNLTYIPAGAWETHFWGARTSGTKSILSRFEVYKRDLAGNETLLATTPNQTIDSALPTQYEIYVSTTEITLLASDRIVLKQYASASGSGSAPTLQLYRNGNYYSDLDFPSIPVTPISYVPYTGATGAVNLDAYGLFTSSNISANAYQINGSTVLSTPVTGTTWIGKSNAPYSAGDKNTFMGAFVSSSCVLSGCTRNTVMGSYAAIAMTSSDNTIVGSESGDKITTGAGNTLIGASAGRSIVNASNVVMVGNGAGYSNISASALVAIGQNAGYYSTSGTNNTYTGALAGQSNISGSNNAAFGTSAGNKALSDYGAFFGASAGAAHTTGQYPTYLGAYAGNSVTIGNENAVVGDFAMRYNVTGSFNAVLGGQSAGASGKSFSKSTVVGYKAGFNLAAGSNTLVGYQAGDSITTGTNNLILGYDTDVPTAGTSNYLNIGDAIYGDMQATSTITFIGGISVDSIVDRTRGPKNITDAWADINSIQFSTTTGQLDHTKLTKSVTGHYKLKKLDHYDVVYETHTFINTNNEEERSTRAIQIPIYILEDHIGRDIFMVISDLVEVVKDLQKIKLDKTQ